MAAKPLVVIAGPTASGKTTLAIDLAKRFGGEIVCADSRTVYRGMDIGTAKPSVDERREVPHWGLDLVEPGERFTAADFKYYAEQKIEEIRAKGRIPFLVGGTGLYIDSVVFDFTFGGVVDDKRRQKLEKMSLDELHKYCEINNINLPENYKNKRYVIRAIEQTASNVGRRREPIDNCIVVGISTEKDKLRTRITLRTEQLLENGVVDEARMLADKFGWDNEAMTGNIYPLCRKFIEGELTIDELKSKSVTLDWRLAKRQSTWLRRNECVQWLNLHQADRYITSILASEH